MATTLYRRNRTHPAGTANGGSPGSLGFIGAGKVGTALASLLNARGAKVVAVSGRSPQSSLGMALAARLSPSAARNRQETLRAARVVFLTVPDDAIGPLCQEIADAKGWRPGQGVVHCSGALPSDVLQPAREAGAQIASFHPLQAFANLQAAIEHMPGSTFALEGDPELVARLDHLVEMLGGTAIHLRAEEKTVYHAAAAIASNYMVTLAALAADLLVREGIAADPNTALHYLLPLLKGTVDNLEALGLPDALTGPLARGDAGTVARHIEALQKVAPDIAELYRHIARLTLPIAEEKGQFDQAITRKLEDVVG